MKWKRCQLVPKDISSAFVSIRCRACNRLLVMESRNASLESSVQRCECGIEYTVEQPRIYVRWETAQQQEAS